MYLFHNLQALHSADPLSVGFTGNNAFSFDLKTDLDFIILLIETHNIYMHNFNFPWMYLGLEEKH